MCNVVVRKVLSIYLKLIKKKNINRNIVYFKSIDLPITKNDQFFFVFIFKRSYHRMFKRNQILRLGIPNNILIYHIYFYRHSPS